MDAKTLAAKNKEYVQGSGAACPYCKSSDITGMCGFESHDSGIVTQRVQCNVCHESWDDIYSLTGFDEVV